MVVLEDFPGSENRVKRQVRVLVDRGHDVRVYCASGASTEDSWWGAAISRSRLRRKKSGGAARRLIEYGVFQLAVTAWSVRQSVSWRPDVVQVANMPDWLVFAAAPARWLCGARLVLDLHDLMPELMLSKGGTSAMSSVLRAVERWSVRYADIVITTSLGFLEVLRLRYPDLRVVLVPNAVDTAEFAVREPCDTPTGVPRITYHGTVIGRFGVETLVVATGSLRHDFEGLRLDIYGSGSDLDRISRVVCDLGLDEIVQLHGQVPASRLPGSLEGSWVSVVPYLSDTFMDLAWSTKAFEAAALGIPLVLSDLPSLREQFDECCAAFYPSGDVEGLRKVLRAVLSHRPEALERARKAQAHVLANWTWNRWGPEYVKLIESAK